MIVTEEVARHWLRSAGLCDAAGFERLEMLVALLAEANTQQNLVSKVSFDDVWRRHILDSAQLLLHVPRETSVRTWLDLGTGAGFPGLVISALRPEINVIMVEARRKRTEWLTDAKNRLGVDRAVVTHGRLEQLEDCQADVISARAFAPLDKLLNLSARFSTEATLWLLPKGRSAKQELADLCGWRHAFHVKQSQSDPESGVIVGHLMGRKVR